MAGRPLHRERIARNNTQTSGAEAQLWLHLERLRRALHGDYSSESALAHAVRESVEAAFFAGRMVAEAHSGGELSDTQRRLFSDYAELVQEELPVEVMRLFRSGRS